MTVRELLDDFQLFEGEIYLYQKEEIFNLFGFDANDDEEILSNAEVVKYELDYGALYIQIK